MGDVGLLDVGDVVEDVLLVWHQVLLLYLLHGGLDGVGDPTSGQASGAGTQVCLR